MLRYQTHIKVDRPVHNCILDLMNRTEKKDLEGYTFIRNRIIHTGVTPSLREIGRTVGYSSPRSTQLLLERLQKRGLLSYQSGIIKLLQQSLMDTTEQTIDVPLLGSVACGLPMLAEQNVEAIVKVSTRIARPGHKYFLLRAKGQSMNKSGINDGDLVLVRQQPTANEGDKVVALVDDEATIKYFHRGDGIVILKPHSTDESYSPILLSSQFLIQGIVVSTLPDPFYSEEDEHGSEKNKLSRN